MKRRCFSPTKSAQGFSVAVSSKLIMSILILYKNVFLHPLFGSLFGEFRESLSDEVAEFTDKLSPLVINKRLSNKHLLGAKITFYYED